jgi:hypothetical protein
MSLLFAAFFGEIARFVLEKAMRERNRDPGGSELAQIHSETARFLGTIRFDGISREIVERKGGHSVG